MQKPNKHYDSQQRYLDWGGGAFFDCSSLTNITIPNSVTSIGRAAFAFCPSPTSVTIPDSVTSIGERAFHFCFRLDSITFEGDAPTLGTDVFEGTDSVKVYYYNDATGLLLRLGRAPKQR